MVIFLQAVLFHRTCDDLESWIDDVESQLASSDNQFKDVTSVKDLLTDHRVLLLQTFSSLL